MIKMGLSRSEEHDEPDQEYAATAATTDLHLPLAGITWKTLNKNNPKTLHPNP